MLTLVYVRTVDGVRMFESSLPINRTVRFMRALLDHRYYVNDTECIDLADLKGFNEVQECNTNVGYYDAAVVLDCVAMQFFAGLTGNRGWHGINCWRD